MRKAEFAQDDDLRVTIYTGAGRAFCSGRDLKETAELVIERVIE